MEWVNDYIGRPWKCNGRGPEYFDCYGLIKDVLRKQLDISLPDYGSESDNTRDMNRAVNQGVLDAERHIVKTDTPEDFDIAVVSSSSGVAVHVGVYVAGGVLHTGRRTGGARFESLKTFNRFNTGKVDYYRWHS